MLLVQWETLDELFFSLQYQAKVETQFDRLLDLSLATFSSCKDYRDVHPLG